MELKPQPSDDAPAALSDQALQTQLLVVTNLLLTSLVRLRQPHLSVFRVPGRDRGVLTTDGVHLNAAGNVFVATQAARALREARRGD